jgi:hypothetical protein
MTLCAARSTPQAWACIPERHAPEEVILFLLFGPLRSGQVTLRRLVGWRDIDNSNSRARAA